MPDKELTIERSMADFKKAYRAKRGLIEREHEDFKFAMGVQWDQADLQKLKAAGVKAVTDNRIQPNIFLLTGLERQNRTDFKAFPEGEEDSVKAEVASALFKNSIKVSDFSYKSSEQFKDGVTCGESHLELYLDYTYNIINGKPCWKKLDGNCVFPEPGAREYDFSDGRYVYKLTTDLSQDDLISLFPDKKDLIEKAESGKLDLSSMMDGSTVHQQHKDYPKKGGDSSVEEEQCFDLVERYYKKWVEKSFVADRATGKINEAETPEKADEFINAYQTQVLQEQEHIAMMHQQMAAAPPAPQAPAPVIPKPKDPNRFTIIKRTVYEIWCFAHVPGIDEPLVDEVAWFFPKWKSYPFIPYYARFSTAPLTGDESHLLVQGIVHGVKNAQERHNKAATLMLRHLNSAANSGWLTQEDSWVDPKAVREFGSTPSANLEYKKGSEKPERIFPMPLSQGHAELTAESAEDIKAQLGINADLLAVQQGAGDSGRAIALRQKQGLLMVQELFDNLSRTRVTAGKFMLSQLGKIYDTESAKKVLGEAFLKQNFPPLMMTNVDSSTGQSSEEPMQDENGLPMEYDKELAELTIAEVLSGDLGEYDVAVGEAVSSETMKMANSAELKDLATTYPGVIPPTLLVEESQLPQGTKNKVLAAIKNAQAAAQAAAGAPPPAA